MADESMLTDKPYFTLRIETKNTLYLAKTNGVIIFTDFSQGNMLMAEKPVNYYMQTGENTISLELFPKREDEFKSANITLSLFVNKDGEAESEKKLVSSITFDGRNYEKGTALELSMPEMKLNSKNNFEKSDVGDVLVQEAKIKPGVIMPNTLTVSQLVTLKTPFPKWGFLEGENIDFPLSYTEYTDNKEHFKEKTVDSLYYEYKKLHDMLSLNKIDEIMHIFKERNKEYDIAMYYPEGTYDKKLRRSLEKDIATLHIKLRSTNFAMPLISDNKKLLKLGDDSMIYFVNDDETSFTKYEIIFYKKDGKWIVSR